MTGMIEATGNPVAPMIVQDLYNALCTTRHIFPCSKADVVACEERLMKDFTDEEINVLSIQPEFITALAILLKASLVRFGSNPLNQVRGRSSGATTHVGAEV